jgi:hypothetical protein
VIRGAEVSKVIVTTEAVLSFEFTLSRATADTKAGNCDNRNVDGFCQRAKACCDGHGFDLRLIYGHHATGEAPDATRNRLILAPRSINSSCHGQSTPMSLC